MIFRSKNSELQMVNSTEADSSKSADGDNMYLVLQSVVVDENEQAPPLSK